MPTVPRPRGDELLQRHGRRIVDRRDLQGHGGHADLQCPVAQAIGEAVLAEEVGLRLVEEAAVDSQRQRAMSRVGELFDDQRFAVGLDVVAAHVEAGAAVFVERHPVVRCMWRVGDRRDRQHHLGGRLTALGIADAVGEALGAEVIGIRRVAQPPVGEHRHLAVRRRAGRGDAQRVAVEVAVVGQDVDIERAVFGQRAEIGLRRRGVVDRPTARRTVAVFDCRLPSLRR
jgi:hypothetical protein